MDSTERFSLVQKELLRATDPSLGQLSMTLINGLRALESKIAQLIKFPKLASFRKMDAARSLISKVTHGEDVLRAIGFELDSEEKFWVLPKLFDSVEEERSFLGQVAGAMKVSMEEVLAEKEEEEGMVTQLDGVLDGAGKMSSSGGGDALGHGGGLVPGGGGGGGGGMPSFS